jgi:hypothetical protein
MKLHSEHSAKKWASLIRSLVGLGLCCQRRITQWTFSEKMSNDPQWVSDCVANAGLHCTVFGAKIIEKPCIQTYCCEFGLKIDYWKSHISLWPGQIFLSHSSWLHSPDYRWMAMDMLVFCVYISGVFCLFGF